MSGCVLGGWLNWPEYITDESNGSYLSQIDENSLFLRKGCLDNLYDVFVLVVIFVLSSFFLLHFILFDF